MEEIVILGAGGLAREVLEIVKQSNRAAVRSKFLQEMVAFVDEDIKKIGHMTNGYPIKSLKWLASRKDIKAVCAIGNNEARKAITMKAEKLGIEFTNVIHPNVQISDFVTFGKGVVVCAGNIITPNTKIGNHVFINMDCTVAHDDILEDYVNLSPGVHVSGNCHLKEGCHIYTNVAIIPGVTIGKWSIIGAGAVVLKDIPDYALAVGVPAVVKEIKICGSRHGD